MLKDIKLTLRQVFPRDLFIDVEDRLLAESVKAHEMIRDYSGLASKRAREAEGQARFRMWEQGFEDVCKLHGGHLLEGSVIPKTELKVFQPFMRFENDNQGVVLGLATMSEPSTLPSKNKSRLAGVSLNYDLSLRLDLDGKGPAVGDIFVVLLVARHRLSAGQIEEVAVGVINSSYESFLYYEPLEMYFSGEVGVSADDDKPTPSVGEADVSPVSKVTLKSKITRFVPPEMPASDDNDEAGG